MPDPLNLTDDAYWNAPTSTLNTVFDALSSENMDGVRIGAPSTVALETRHSVPLVAYRGGSHLDVRRLAFGKHAILTAMDLDRNALRVADAVDFRDGFGAADASAPIPKGYIASPYVIDARERLGLPWQPGSYLVSIVMRDCVSNRVKVDLGKSSAGFQDDEVRKFITTHRKQQTPAAVSPATGDSLPWYRKLSESPEIPSKNGIALNVERVLLLNSETRWKVFGAFRVPAFSHEVVPPAPATTIDSFSEKILRPTAIVRITMLITGADSGRWAVLELRAPSYDPIDESDEKPVVTGYFALDLMAELPQLSAAPQTFFIYLFSGEILEGPIPSALVPEYLLQTER